MGGGVGGRFAAMVTVSSGVSKYCPAGVFNLGVIVFALLLSFIVLGVVSLDLGVLVFGVDFARGLGFLGLGVVAMGWGVLALGFMGVLVRGFVGLVFVLVVFSALVFLVLLVGLAAGLVSSMLIEMESSESELDSTVSTKMVVLLVLVLGLDVGLGVKNDALEGMVVLVGAFAERRVIILVVPEVMGGGLTPGGESVHGWVMGGSRLGEDGGESPVGDSGVPSNEGSSKDAVILDGDMMKIFLWFFKGVF